MLAWRKAGNFCLADSDVSRHSGVKSNAVFLALFLLFPSKNFPASFDFSHQLDQEGHGHHSLMGSVAFGHAR